MISDGVLLLIFGSRVLTGLQLFNASFQHQHVLTITRTYTAYGHDQEVHIHVCMALHGMLSTTWQPHFLPLRYLPHIFESAAGDSPHILYK